MIGFITSKEELKTSKRVTLKDAQSVETRYLLNVTQEDFNSISAGTIAEIRTEGDWKGIPIIVEFHVLSNLGEEDPRFAEYDRLVKMYGPKEVPSFREVLLKVVEFVNTTPDQSNIKGEPRHIEYDTFAKALSNYLTDVKTVIEIDDNGEVKVDKVEVSRLHDFMKCPASTIYHDSQAGGLVRHIAKMFSLTMFAFKSNYNQYEIHPLTLMVAVLMHDMGKIDQYQLKPTGGYEVTEHSNYRGSHIGMGLERWARNGRKFLEDIGVIPQDIEKLFWDIWHIIGSHHGPTDNKMGSAWNPFGHDAWTIHSIDLLESRQEEVLKPVRLS